MLLQTRSTGTLLVELSAIAPDQLTDDRCQGLETTCDLDDGQAADRRWRVEHATASVGSRYETATSAGTIPSPTPDWIAAARRPGLASAESVSHVSVPAVDWFTIATRGCVPGRSWRPCCTYR